MNGPEHYRLAEDLAHDARLILERQTPSTANEANIGAAALAAVAQVHATLALAAAMAHTACGMTADGNTSAAWRTAIIDRTRGLDRCTDSTDCASDVHIIGCPSKANR
ncbi:hypothetical protein [Nocardioides sp. LML1-1-1.1]|uniref:hypothetical protein n=1 Tax=Nocardioides sp. LML1-1-1.1 TaxID=3135248 RepID=UPI00341ED056